MPSPSSMNKVNNHVDRTTTKYTGAVNNDEKLQASRSLASSTNDTDKSTPATTRATSLDSIPSSLCSFDPQTFEVVQPFQAPDRTGSLEGDTAEDAHIACGAPAPPTPLRHSVSYDEGRANKTSASQLRLLPSLEGSCSISASSCEDCDSEDYDMDDTYDSVSETESLTSTYFDRTDFEPAYWLQSMDGPTMGFAIVALATAITHPILFAAGALTAFGTVQAVGAGYQLCSANWCRMWAPYETDASSKPEKDLDYPLDITPHETISESDKQAPKYDLDKLVDHDDSEKASTVGTQTDHDTTTTASTTTPVHMNGRVLSIKHKQDHDEWLEIVNDQFPPLENQISVCPVEFSGLNAVEFFEVFWDDNAPYHYRELQKKRGDLDIEYEPWHDIEVQPDRSASLSMHKDAPPMAERAREELLHQARQQTNDKPPSSSFRGRRIQFRAKTSSFIGPMYATTRRTQRLWLPSKRLAVIESKTELSDVPFCQTFYVMERWIIAAEKTEDQGNQGKYRCKLNCSSQVFFTKKCAWESQIMSRSKATIEQLAVVWCSMATEALKLTEQRKLQRLQQKQKGGESTDGQGIEVGLEGEVDLIAKLPFAPPVPYRRSESAPLMIGDNGKSNAIAALRSLRRSLQFLKRQ